MKKIIFLIAITCYTSITFAQTNKPTHEIDWNNFKASILDANKNKNLLEPVKTGEFSIFQIKNINKFFWKVTIKGQNVELQTPVPTELQTLFRLSADDLKKQVQNNTEEDTKNATKTQLGIMQSLDESVSSVAPATRSNDGSTQTEVINQIKTIIKKCSIYIDKLTNYTTAISDLKYLKLQLILLSQEDIDPNTMKKKVNELKVGDYSKDKIDKLLKELKQTYGAVIVEYEKAVKKTEGFATNGYSDKIQEVENEIYNQYTKAINEDVLGLLADIIFLSTELKNEKNFIAIAPPVQMDGDIVSYTINIEPTNTNKLGAFINPINFNLDIPAKGGLKVDFSVGPTFSFGDNARDDIYFLKDGTKPDSGLLAKRNNNNFAAPSIAALMHVYGRSGKTWNLAGSFGVGAGFQNTTDVNYSAFAGISAVGGKRQKVVFTLGYSLLRVLRLKDAQFEVGKPYLKSSFDATAITEKVFKPSWFIGISYNLTNRVEIK